jgi:hypothetical protein
MLEATYLSLIVLAALAMAAAAAVMVVRLFRGQR